MNKPMNANLSNAQMPAQHRAQHNKPFALACDQLPHSRAATYMTDIMICFRSISDHFTLAIAAMQHTTDSHAKTFSYNAPHHT